MVGLFSVITPNHWVLSNNASIRYFSPWMHNPGNIPLWTTEERNKRFTGPLPRDVFQEDVRRLGDPWHALARGQKQCQQGVNHQRSNRICVRVLKPDRHPQIQIFVWNSALCGTSQTRGSPGNFGCGRKRTKRIGDDEPKWLASRGTCELFTHLLKIGWQRLLLRKSI